MRQLSGSCKSWGRDRFITKLIFSWLVWLTDGILRGRNVQNICRLWENGPSAYLADYGIKECVIFCAHVHFSHQNEWTRDLHAVFLHKGSDRTHLTLIQEITRQLTLSVSELSLVLIANILENTCAGIIMPLGYIRMWVYCFRNKVNPEFSVP